MDILSFVFVIVLFFIDRVSKHLAVVYLKPVYQIKLLPQILNLTYIENQGAAFGILREHKSLLFWATVIAFFLFFKCSHWISEIKSGGSSTALKFCLATVFAGALGNLYDRFFRGSVTDFLELAFIDFPVFNLADVFLTFGCAALFFLGVHGK